MALKWLLFDLDGTLIDSKKCVFTVYTRLFNELGIAIPSDDEMRSFIGPPIEETIIKYIKDTNVTKYCNRFREIYSSLDLKENNRLFDDVPKMLKILKDEGYKLAICSTKNYKFMGQILELLGIDKFFELTAGSNPGKKIISKTDVLNDAIERGIDINSCLLIGDTIFDVEGAVNAKIPVAIVNYGFGNKEDFVNQNIVWFCDTVMEIVDKVHSTKI
ncbi:MAG: HAD hydrolase-like protein [Clostridia bacterium]